jgi:hypothetical protein
MHVQSLALAGGTHQTLVEGDIRAQTGDLFVALGQRGLDFGIGGAADPVGHRQRGLALTQAAQPILILVQLLLHLPQTLNGVRKRRCGGVSSRDPSRRHRCSPGQDDQGQREPPP